VYFAGSNTPSVRTFFHVFFVGVAVDRLLST
jgi:hypothetical protein